MSGIGMPDVAGCTALMLAVRSGHLPLIEALLRAAETQCSAEDSSGAVMCVALEAEKIGWRSLASALGLGGPIAAGGSPVVEAAPEAVEEQQASSWYVVGKAAPGGGGKAAPAVELDVTLGGPAFEADGAVAVQQPAAQVDIATAIAAVAGVGSPPSLEEIVTAGVPSAVDSVFLPALGALEGATVQRAVELRGVTWQRASEVCGRGATLFAAPKPLSLLPISPGPLGGTWFWSALGAAAEGFVPREAFPDGGPTAPGVYRVRLMQPSGASVEVLVDEWVPCLGSRLMNGEHAAAPAYGWIGEAQEMWSLLYAKACAKALGSFGSAFASPRQGSPEDLEQAIASLELGELDASLTALVSPVLQLLGLVGSSRPPYLGPNELDAAGVASDLAELAEEFIGAPTVVNSRGMPQFLVHPDSPTEMSILVTGEVVPQDLTATVLTADGSTVAMLTAPNMSYDSTYTLTLNAVSAPYTVSFMSEEDLQSLRNLDIGFDFDREGIQVEAVHEEEAEEEVAEEDVVPDA